MKVERNIPTSVLKSSVPGLDDGCALGAVFCCISFSILFEKEGFSRLLARIEVPSPPLPLSPVALWKLAPLVQELRANEDRFPNGMESFHLFLKEMFLSRAGSLCYKYPM